MASTGGPTRATRRIEGPFVGREDLVGELVSTSDGAAGGRGAIVLLTGEAGIGKTSVVRALADRVRERLAVSWGTCPGDQSAPPFWPWQALVPIDDHEPQLSIDEAVGAPRLGRLTALRDLIRERIGQRPRMHVIEDLQWADVASVLLLVHVGEIVLDSHLLVVATLRTGEQRSPQLDDAIEALRRVASVREVPPLDDTDIAALIEATGVAADERLRHLIGARTRGNPLFVSEILRTVPKSAAADRQLEVVAATVPARVSDLVVHRLGRLPEPVAGALVTASVMGSEGSTTTLAAAHGAEIERLLELLDQARAAHVLDVAGGRWSFRHQIVRDAVYGSASERDRARRHARVLDALATDASTPPQALARHALAALPVCDADRAVALAARAGEAALAQHAYEEAVEWFTQALAAAPPDTMARWRAELLVRCGEAHRHIGDIGAAREAFVRAAELDEPDLLARAALGYASPGADLGIAYRNDDVVTAALLERAIAAQPAADSVTTVRLEARLAAELYFSDDPARARELARSAQNRAARLEDPRALGAATAVVHDAFVVGHAALEEQLAESAELRAWARATGSVDASLTAHRARVIDLLAAGDLAAMDTEVLAFRRLAEPLRVPGYLWWPALWSAMRALLEGRHQVAEERALAAYALGETPFPSLAFVNLSFLLFFLRREQGRLSEMEQATRDYAASHADIPALRVALAFLLAELGRIDEAQGALAAFDDAALARLHDRNWPASWFQLARAASIVGDRVLATTLLEHRHRPTERCVQVSLATVCLGAADLATAWLMHTVGDLDAADAHYRSAEDLNAQIGARSWLAQARADHAGLLRERDRAGDRERADGLLELAESGAREIGLLTFTGAPERSAALATARFRREGATWSVAFAGLTIQLRDARGLRDIAYLLARPGEAVSVLELVDVDGALPASSRGAQALDERARREIRERLHELDAEEAEAEAIGDGEQAALVRERRQQLAEIVARDFGLGGRARLVGDPIERARKTVSTRIRRTITTIGGAHPQLGRHLDRSIDTGAWCAYRPAEPVDWHT